MLALSHPSRTRLRLLNPADGPAFAKLRIEALETDARVFGSRFFGRTLKDAQKFTDAQWRERCRDTGKGGRFVVGLFDQKSNELIGMAAVLPWPVNRPRTPANKRYQVKRTALITSAYIKRAYRGKGLAWPLNTARMQQVLEHGYDNIVLFIRSGHEVSARIQKTMGARFWCRRPHRWGDGQLSTADWYRIPSLKSRQRAHKALAL